MDMPHLKAFQIVLLILYFLCCTGKVSADYMAGMAINSSSNMLLRPNGKSGTITYLYGKAAFSAGKADFSYGINGGMVEHYQGLQFQKHDVNASYLLISKDNFACNTVLEGIFSKYGNMTSLDGYKHFRISSNIRSYLTESLLLRWKGTFGHRFYSTFNRESYSEASAIFRLDRFFRTGTTLRGQFDAGIRSYNKQTSKPEASLLGISTRIAQSIRPGWGIMIEAFKRNVKAFSSLDSSRVFNRVFLDDIYKYSSVGLVGSTTYLIRRINSIQFKGLYSKRTYSNSQTSYFWYLPPEGWKEHETAFFLTVKYQPGFIPEIIHPVFEIYHLNVKATENKFSYDSSGLTMKIEIY